MRENKPVRSWGRCPDCGAAVEVEVRKPDLARVLPHGCPARVCEYPGCRVSEVHDRMVHTDDGAWFCPPHGLLVTAKALVALYCVEGDADWSQICEVITEALRAVINKVEAAESGASRLDHRRR